MPTLACVATFERRAAARKELAGAAADMATPLNDLLLPATWPMKDARNAGTCIPTIEWVAL